MVCFHVCLGEEHTHSELCAHHDESRCLGPRCLDLAVLICETGCWISQIILGCYDDEVRAQSRFSPDSTGSWAELYSAQLCLSNMHVIVFGEPRWA